MTFLVIWLENILKDILLFITCWITHVVIKQETDIKVTLANKTWLSKLSKLSKSIGSMHPINQKARQKQHWNQVYWIVLFNKAATLAMAEIMSTTSSHHIM